MACVDKPFLPVVKRLPWNTSGRDFVVGDLHGCFSDLMELLRKVSFDGRVDRLLSVGDLADRGPDSWGCLSLLLEPWFFAVIGNHEDMLIDHVWSKTGIGERKFYMPQDFINNGGGWYSGEKGPSGSVKEKILSLVRELPHLLVVENNDIRFNVVHGELQTFNGGLFMFGDEDIDLWMSGKNGRHPLDEWDLIWERNIFIQKGSFLPERRNDLSPTFCGHTIMENITIRNSQICLDTGAFKAYFKNGRPLSRLSMVDAVSFVETQKWFKSCSKRTGAKK